MLCFDPLNPFPLLAEGEATYQAAQAHSGLVDEWLGFKLDPIEERLSNERENFDTARDEQHWIGLPIKTLQTPYTEIRSLLSQLVLHPGDRVVDLGAGYGRMGFVIAQHFPGVAFTGYEVVAERVAEGQRVLGLFCRGLRGLGHSVPDADAKRTDVRLGLQSSVAPTIELLQADLSRADFAPVEASFYFLYDFGSRQAIAKTLNDLREISMREPITVIGRGRASRDAIERGEPWLSQVNPPRHFEHFSIYRS